MAPFFMQKPDTVKQT